MTEDDAHATIARWLPRLGLDHWVVVVEIGGVEGEDSYAEVSRHDTAHRAIINLQPWAVGQAEPPEWVRDDLASEAFAERMLVHELAHLLFRDVKHFTHDLLERALGEPAYQAAADALGRMEERVVDDLARGLVASWPSATDARREPERPGERKSMILGRDDRPQRHEWLSQELDDSVHVVPLHEEGHSLGRPPGAESWCWCDPEVEEHRGGRPLVTHRDVLERATGETI